MKNNPAHFRGCPCPECAAVREERALWRILWVCLLFTAACSIGFAVAGCASVPAPAGRILPSGRTVQSLQAVGHAAEATVELSAQLYRDQRITAGQARAIADFYDGKFQPAYRAAVAAAQLDLSRPAPDQLLQLAAQLSTLLPADTKP